jgi:hypothetical protein
MVTVYIAGHNFTFVGHLRRDVRRKKLKTKFLYHSQHAAFLKTVTLNAI